MNRELSLKKTALREAERAIGKKKVIDIMVDVWTLKQALPGEIFNHFILNLTHEPSIEIKEFIAKMQTEELIMNKYEDVKTNKR